MTTETRTLIDFEDITGVEIECPKCHLVVTHPVSQALKSKADCPQCNETWFDHRDDFRSLTCPVLDQLQSLTETLRKLTREDRTDIHAHIRLRVNISVENAPVPASKN